MADIFCTGCNKHTEVVFDHTSRDTVCSECGLILESLSILESSESRTFTESYSNDTDQIRVGSPTPTRTPITLPESPPFDKRSRRLVSASYTISTMADRLSLVSTIKDRANEIYKNLIDNNDRNKHHFCRGKSLDTILAACLFVACQQENLPRTLKEICSVTGNTTNSKKEIGRAKSFIMQHLKDFDNVDNTNSNTNNSNKVVRSSNFVKRFCSNVGIMDTRAMKAAFEAAVKSEEEIDVRRSPLSVAAAVVYIVGKLCVETSERVGYKDIAVATGVAEGTIKSSCKDLLPYVERIIPKWFASGDDFKVLCSSN